jgi:hypothetical protein
MPSVSCPDCGEPVELTAADLAAQQGYCPSCDRMFATDPARWVGEGPLRELVVVAPLERRPPTRHITFHRDGRTTRVLVAQAGPRVRDVLVGFAALMMATWLAERGGLATVGGLLGCGAVGWVIVWWVLGYEEIVITGDRLSRRRGALRSGREQWVPLREVERLEADGSSVVVVRRGGAPVRLAARLHHRRESLRWLQKRLERRIAG